MRESFLWWASCRCIEWIYIKNLAEEVLVLACVVSINGSCSSYRLKVLVQLQIVYLMGCKLTCPQCKTPPVSLLNSDSELAAGSHVATGISK